MKDHLQVRKIAYFTAACFIYTSTMSMLNRDIAGSVEGKHLYLYMLQSFALALGMLLYPILRQTLGMSRRLLNAVLIASSMVYAAGVLSAGHIDSYAYVVALMFMLPVAMGYCQGAAYVHIAQDMYDEDMIGRVFGISMGISILLQYLIQIRFNIGILLPVFMCCLYFFLIILEFRGSETGDGSADTEDGSVYPVSRTILLSSRTNVSDPFVRLIVVAGFLDILAIYLDGQMEHLLDTSDFFSWSRLLFGAGFVAMGFLWDMAKARLASMTMITAAIMAVLMPALLMEERFRTFDVCFFYFYLGLCVVYNSLRLIQYANRHGNMYAAVAYRVIDNLITGVMVLVGFSALPQLAALVINTILLALIVILMWKDGALDHAKSPASDEASRDRMTMFTRKYSLTDRESEVLELLITKDEKGDDMARELGVSRRGFVSLTSSIYRKTDTGSRVALLQKYMSE